MKIEELTDCPDWLKEAVTENADVTIVAGVVHWHSGIWHDGTWENGVWETGLWKGGTWKHGLWKSGTWEGGTWHNGFWHNGHWNSGTWKFGTWVDGRWHKGIWENGVWEDGIWGDGTWNSGTWNAGTWEGGTWYGGVWENGIWKGAGNQYQRIKYSPSLRKDKTITIGCKTKSREEWDKWFAGTEEYKTPRGTPTFKLIVANYKAFIAYAEELELIPKK